MRRVYVDTSALFALMDADDLFHLEVQKTWNDLLDQGKSLFTSNYVLVEVCALLQRRLGLEALRVFHHDIYPILHMLWAEPESYGEAMATLLALNRSGLSLVDCFSFHAMRAHHIDTVFTFDKDFAAQGFILLPTGQVTRADLIHER